MKNEKNSGIKLNLGFLDKIISAADELSKQQGTKTFKIGTGKEAVFSSTLNVGPLKKPETDPHKKKETIKPETEEREPLADLFDEGEKLKVITELPGTEKKNIKIELKKDKITISTKDKKYHKELDLPSKVKLEKKWTYKNGVLEITLEKE